jgi:hypothetical protein
MNEPLAAMNMGASGRPPFKPDCLAGNGSNADTGDGSNAAARMASATKSLPDVPVAPREFDRLFLLEFVTGPSYVVQTGNFHLRFRDARKAWSGV